MIRRQGDLTFIQVSDDKADQIRAGEASKVRLLAKGEQSGHWHATSVEVLERYIDGERYLIVDQPTEVVVEPATHAGRHAPVLLPVGVHRIPGEADQASMWLGQREYSPEAIRGVAD